MSQELSASAGLESANWQYYPTPSVTLEAVSASPTDRLYQGDNGVATLRLQQPLWTGGRLGAGVDKAQAALEASRFAVEEARYQVAGRVIQSYGDWLSAHLRAQSTEKSLATHDRLRLQVERRLAQGASAASDLTLAVARLQSVASDLASSRAQADVALVRLGQLVGRRVDGADLVPAAARTRAGEPGAMLQQALAIHPAVLKAQAQARAQEAAVAEKRADLSPEVFVRLERQHGNYAFPNAAPENRLFLGLNTRFGAGLSSLSGVEAARQQHQSALAEVQVQARAAGEQVLADAALVASVEARMTALKASLESAAEVAASYDRQFLAGRKAWLDVMNAARELAQTEVQLAELHASHVAASWRLALATGGIAALTVGLP